MKLDTRLKIGNIIDGVERFCPSRCKTFKRKAEPCVGTISAPAPALETTRLYWSPGESTLLTPGALVWHLIDEFPETDAGRLAFPLTYAAPLSADLPLKCLPFSLDGT